MTTLNMRDAAEDGRRHYLTGLEAGQRARKRLGIAELDRDGFPVKVVVPNEIHMITPTFFTGMFGPSVIEFGSAEGFMEKYRFKCTPLMRRQIRNRARSVELARSAAA